MGSLMNEKRIAERVARSVTADWATQAEREVVKALSKAQDVVREHIEDVDTGWPSGHESEPLRDVDEMIEKVKDRVGRFPR